MNLKCKCPSLLFEIRDLKKIEARCVNFELSYYVSFTSILISNDMRSPRIERYIGLQAMTERCTRTNTKWSSLLCSTVVNLLCMISLFNRDSEL